MAFFSGVQSLRMRSHVSPQGPPELFSMSPTDFYPAANSIMGNSPPPHSSHPDFANLTLLVFEAVLEVVCVSAPGYIIARLGMFDAENQKFLANLNTQLFTPCLIFTKLASQLTTSKLVELGVIPWIFCVQLLVSYLTARLISRLFRFNKRAENFVVAMAVFGNSNSLPISLVISLSKTLSGLHWEKVPGDNDNEVAARGILYLLIFQQLGQLVRWTWGFNVLLAPASAYKDADQGETAPLRGDYTDDDEPEGQLSRNRSPYDAQSDYGSGNITPEQRRTYATSTSESTCSSEPDTLTQQDDVVSNAKFATPTNGNAVVKGPGSLVTRHRGDSNVGNGSAALSKTDRLLKVPKGWWTCFIGAMRRITQSISNGISRASRRSYSVLPRPVQRTLETVHSCASKFLIGLWQFMNPPLWAMLAAITVASVPTLQHGFFNPGTFISNSVTRAIAQSGQVAVPLILVVLGANLARNTLPKPDHSMEDPGVEKKLVIASLLSRMLVPTIIMAPLLAVTAKYIQVSIVDDPIFVIVCFLLTGAPSALQLAQICQINNVYMGAMSKILFHSYVVWILPSTLVLVMLALETVEWAAAP